MNTKADHSADLSNPVALEKMRYQDTIKRNMNESGRSTVKDLLG